MHCVTAPCASWAAPAERGIARGVDADGALLVERDGRIHRIIGGEVSVRAGIHEHIAVRRGQLPPQVGAGK